MDEEYVVGELTRIARVLSREKNAAVLWPNSDLPDRFAMLLKEELDDKYGSGRFYAKNIRGREFLVDSVAGEELFEISDSMSVDDVVDEVREHV